MIHFRKLQRGQALLTGVVLLLFISSAAVFGFSTIVLSEMRAARGEEISARSYIVAEAGAEDVTYRILRGKAYNSPEILVIGDASATTTITTFGTTREVISQAGVSSRFRKVKHTLTNLSGVSFVYGVQVGDGGLILRNSSRVNGSVYSNGPIIGENSSRVTGDAFAATTSAITNVDNIDGNARAHSIDDTIVGGSATSTTSFSDGSIGVNVYANTVTNSSITRRLYYCTSQSGNTIGVPPAILSCPAPTDLPTLSMPISDAQLDQWEQDAVSGGTISSPCPYKPANGTSLGPVKINCDMEVDDSKTVTLTGTVWIAGTFTMKNSAILRLSSTFGSLSGIVIADNTANRTTSSEIKIQNSSQVLGSGEPGSYIMLVSRNNSAEGGGSDEAVDIGNSSTAAIYYAPHGQISISNNVNLKEATGWKIEAKNSSVITYESGLSSVQFSSGPTGGYWLQSWSEVQ